MHLIGLIQLYILSIIRVKIDQYSIPGYNVLSNTRIEDGLNDINSRDAKSSEDGSNDIRSRGENKTRWMIAVNELGI